MGILVALLCTLAVLLLVKESAADFDAKKLELRLNSHQEFDQCDFWAEHDGECVNNPRFMWSACLKSCLKFAKDDDERCQSWAREGECEANPGYIQLHCPGNCSLAAAWDPWVRQTLNIDRIRNAAFVADRVDVSDLVSAASLLQSRLESVFLYYNPYVQGFSLSAPSHFLGMVGLAEAFLYTLRLQEVVLHHLGDEEAFADLRDRIDQALRTVELSHFNADLLSRELTFWMRFVGESSRLIQQAMERAQQQSLRLPAVKVAEYFAAYAPSAASGLPEDPVALADVPSAPTTVRLSDGHEMPLLGLGTWQLDGDACFDAVVAALTVGYRAIDTAQAYGNEAEVGRALAEALQRGVIGGRHEVFLATKVSDERDLGDNVRALVERQLQLLRTDYVDLYMLHSPPRSAEVEAATWHALEALVAEGKIRSLGVSNYEPRELDRLLSAARSVKPSVVQNKVDVFHVGKQLDVSGDEIVAFCRQRGLQLVGYSPFSAYPFVMEPTQDPLVRLIAQQRTARQSPAQHPVTPAQIVLKWMLQRGIAAIPRSSHPGRLAENLRALRLAPLTADELAVLDTLQSLVSSPVSVPIALV